jgi:hypothetical protein
MLKEIYTKPNAEYANDFADRSFEKTPDRIHITNRAKIIIKRVLDPHRKGIGRSGAHPNKITLHL